MPQVCCKLRLVASVACFNEGIGAYVEAVPSCRHWLPALAVTLKMARFGKTGRSASDPQADRAGAKDLGGHCRCADWRRSRRGCWHCAAALRGSRIGVVACWGAALRGDTPSLQVLPPRAGETIEGPPAERGRKEKLQGMKGMNKGEGKARRTSELGS